MPWWSTSHGALPSVAADHHRERDAVEHQPERELREPARQAPGPQLRDGAEPGELAHPPRGRVAEGVSRPRSLVMGPVHHEVVWFDIANRGSLACMTRLVSASRIATLLGELRPLPAYRGLAEGLRVLITDGRVPVGVRLPSERELTDALAVSRTTVTRAYAELRDHGFLVSRQGSGSVASLPASRGHRGDHLLPPGDLPEDKIDLTCAAPVPGPGVLGAYERAVAELPGLPRRAPATTPPACPMLREAVAASYAARGLPTSPDQVLVVPGRPRRRGRRGPRPARHRRPRRHREPDLPQRHRHAGPLGRTRRRGRRAPRGDADTEALTTTLRQVVATGRLPDPRLPQPDRAR